MATATKRPKNTQDAHTSQTKSQRQTAHETVVRDVARAAIKQWEKVLRDLANY